MLYWGSISSIKGSHRTLVYQVHLGCLIVAACLSSTIILQYIGWFEEEDVEGRGVVPDHANPIT
jgi:hypothetical protein